MRPLLVGEPNPRGSDPRLALWPSPAGSSGHRLATLVLGLTEAEYLARFDRSNLCAGSWCDCWAAMAASAVSAERVVLLGARVCRAFAVDYEPLALRRLAGRTVLVLPHPSGLCRFWNDRANRLLARARVEELVGAKRSPGPHTGGEVDW